MTFLFFLDALSYYQVSDNVPLRECDYLLVCRPGAQNGKTGTKTSIELHNVNTNQSPS